LTQARSVLALAVVASFAVSAFAQTPVRRDPSPPEASRTPLTKKVAPGGASSATSTVKPAATPAKTPPAAPQATSPLVPAPASDAVAPSFGIVGDRAATLVSDVASHASASLGLGPRYVPVTVTNRNGDRATRVNPADIGIVEDGVKMRVTSLERWPLWLVVVLDVGRQVGPMKQLAVHRQLVYDLVSALGEDDHIALVQYSDGVELIQPWTLDPRDAERALESRFESGLEGQFWDSVSYASKELLADKVGTKTVVVITDGVDDVSQTISFNRAFELLRKSATTLHIINLSRYLDEQIRKQAYGVNGVLNVIQSPSYIGRRKELRNYRDKLGEAPAQMEQATRDTGGKLWLASPDEDLASLPTRVWRQIDGQYMAGYIPDRQEDRPSSNAVRALSVFVRRGDIEARVPPNLLVPITPYRQGGTVLYKK
jgi:VWFA-related protein